MYSKPMWKSQNALIVMTSLSYTQIINYIWRSVFINPVTLVIFFFFLSHKTSLFRAAMCQSKSPADLWRPSWLIENFYNVSHSTSKITPLFTWIWSTSSISIVFFKTCSRVNYAKCLDIINTLRGHFTFWVSVPHSPTPSRLTDSVGEVQSLWMWFGRRKLRRLRKNGNLFL